MGRPSLGSSYRRHGLLFTAGAAGGLAAPAERLLGRADVSAVAPRLEGEAFVDASPA